ncbi:GNAT family N-acetyltransferase [Vibrio splendidus]|uniref:GNAT family N-acetyltransferase n=1 Tax=Vibrio lentus TaxID=136468 RepID=UPI000C087407|nr:GNAT family N-acetyltransferase [Vibrio lentus]PHN87565.1 GNAT family N-acetyltransferase [Vibrio splendidus]MCC4814995.1 GNAT family N-acetyltransferase [Vibrio lentus]PME63394.1 GNAT family N-acetyltransferase [Vibrio lentus]PMG74647.1 GNAT family N-acetyltransferase [Vibrio lentus]PMK88620.1 GNAT family N-acetyltransferase [Vibrio lentus]
MEEYLELDMLTLEAISKEAGFPIEREVYLASRAESIEQGLLFEYRRKDQLIGYTTLRNLGDGRWFVPMFVVHPNYRSKAAFLALFRSIAETLKNNQANVLVSNVLRINELSVQFHKHLGFEITRENHLGYEFTLDLTPDVKDKWSTFLRVRR